MGFDGTERHESVPAAIAGCAAISVPALTAATVFWIATFGLRLYLTVITRSGYTYGALATPIAFLLFAFFLGFAIMLGAELNNAIQEEFPAPETHADQLRTWLESRNNGKSGGTNPCDSADPAVDPDRVSGDGVVIHPGCRISGARTVLSAGVTLGAEGPDVGDVPVDVADDEGVADHPHPPAELPVEEGCVVDGHAEAVLEIGGTHVEDDGILVA
mgnify:CR=1 FL=1